MLLVLKIRGPITLSSSEKKSGKSDSERGLGQKEEMTYKVSENDVFSNILPTSTGTQIQWSQKQKS